MRRCFPTRLGDLWHGFKEEHPYISALIAEGSVPDVWRRVVGDAIADSSEVKFLKGVMYVKVGPSVLRHEIFMNRENFRYEINAQLGSEVVKSIVVK